ncbi:MAG: glycosyltransferase family 2 protein [Phycisphaerales bacterium]
MDSRTPDCSSILLAIPVFNEARSIERVLSEVRRYARDILVIDDGSSDETPCLLARQPVEVIRHAENRGYGRSMQDILRWGHFDGYEWVITLDCDEQHEPASIPTFVEAIGRGDADVVSGSRYLLPFDADQAPPPERRRINETITTDLNARLGLSLTDAFCGFKAYRVSACRRLALDVDGYDFPMQFWVQAVAHGLRIREIPVRLIYNDPNRSFGGPLDDPVRRLAAYRQTLRRELEKCRHLLPSSVHDAAGE